MHTHFFFPSARALRTALWPGLAAQSNEWIFPSIRRAYGEQWAWLNSLSLPAGDVRSVLDAGDSSRCYVHSIVDSNFSRYETNHFPMRRNTYANGFWFSIAVRFCAIFEILFSVNHSRFYSTLNWKIQESSILITIFFSEYQFEWNIGKCARRSANLVLAYLCPVPIGILWIITGNGNFQQQISTLAKQNRATTLWNTEVNKKLFTKKGIQKSKARIRSSRKLVCPT